MFSRVARVCKNDQGGPNKSKNSWTSYLKTRLNCSVPGDYPFYFDEIQGISELVQGQYGPESDGRDSVIYATFTTPTNSIGASAVCAFRLREISDAFSGRFKEQRSSGENWLAVDENKVRRIYPFDLKLESCSNKGRIFFRFRHRDQELATTTRKVFQIRT